LGSDEAVIPVEHLGSLLQWYNGNIQIGTCSRSLKTYFPVSNFEILG
jgi:hypothetical protein